MADRPTVSFDFDGVLARSPFAHGVLYPLLDELAQQRARETGCVVQVALAEFREQIWAEHRRRIDAESFVEAYHWGAIVRVVAQDMGQPFQGSLGTMTRDFARSLTPQAASALLYPHSRRAVSRIKSRGFRTILVTNGYRDYQLPLLEALGLATFFDAVFASDDLGSVKPLADAFRLAFQGEDTRAGHCHVGDSLTQDVAGAHGVGLFAVWIHRELPENLSGLGPRARAASADLEPVLRTKLAREEAMTPHSSMHGDLQPDIRPDAVVSSLDELGPLLDDGFSSD